MFQCVRVLYGLRGSFYVRLYPQLGSEGRGGNNSRKGIRSRNGPRPITFTAGTTLNTDAAVHVRRGMTRSKITKNKERKKKQERRSIQPSSFAKTGRSSTRIRACAMARMSPPGPALTAQLCEGSLGCS